MTELVDQMRTLDVELKDGFIYLTLAGHENKVTFMKVPVDIQVGMGDSVSAQFLLQSGT